LAELAARGSEAVTAESISRAQGVPLKFLLGILGELRRAGLVRSQRGPSGGYLLDRPPGDITIADVMRAVDGPLASVQDAKPEDVSYPGPAAKLQDATTRIYEACSFQDITGQRITKVVATLKTIEATVAQIVATFGRSDSDRPTEIGAEPADVALLNGPQHPAVAMDQYDIDKLLASFE